MRRLFPFLPLALLGCLVSGDSFTSKASAEANPPAAHQLRIATLAPRQSGLGKAFQQLRRELKERTEGQVNLKMYDGGVAGDEMTVVRKMRVGQLDGALLTSTGLGALVPQVLVLQAPGLITSYPALDDVREELGPDLEALFDKAGYALISYDESLHRSHGRQRRDDGPAGGLLRPSNRDGGHRDSVFDRRARISVAHAAQDDDQARRRHRRRRVRHQEGPSRLASERGPRLHSAKRDRPRRRIP
ncbi:MAG: TRAP transporter substrate-binding protein DctP [Deltaproteobacteria bacterium]|nr:TRAP transporter substrate-binding protein DctP [Deltaproteobacteria bacterium]